VERWCEMMDHVQNALSHLLWQREEIHRVGRMIEANPRLKASPKPFLSDVLLWYTTFAVMAVRRQSDCDDDVVSLRRILHEIGQHPECINREMIIGMFGSHDPRYPADIEQFLIESMWKDFAALDDSFDTSKLAADVAQLDHISWAITRLANKTMAHATRQGLAMTSMPTFKELDDCIDAYDQIAVKYVRLILGASTAGGSLAATEQFDWYEEFRFPWKPRELAPGGPRK
jgi:hypothetical protein